MQVIEIDPQQVQQARKQAIVMGLVMGIIAIVFSTIQYKFFLNSWTNSMVVSSLGFIVIVALMYYSATMQRKVFGGYIDFKRLFGLLFITVLVFALLSHAYDLIYTHYIDPDFNKKVADATIGLLEKMNMPEDALDKARADIEEQSAGGLGIDTVVLGYFYKVIGYSIIALIIALAVKRDTVKTSVPLPQ